MLLSLTTQLFQIWNIEGIFYSLLIMPCLFDITILQNDEFDGTEIFLLLLN